MATHGKPTTLRPGQARAIEALLASESVPEAARLAGVPQRTLYRWLDEPAFAAALRRAESRIIDEAARRLARVTTKAIATLEAMLDDPSVPAATRVRAALGVLDQAIRLRELRDITERVAQLEEIAHAMANYDTAH